MNLTTEQIVEMSRQFAVAVVLCSFFSAFLGYLCWHLVRMAGEEIQERFRRKRWSAKYRLAVLESRQRNARKAMIWQHRFLKRVQRLIDREKIAVTSERS
ncbi:hypothetical protein RN01_16680 [Cupriavidus sp. SHE]|uniref:hypothetical protein n=1 Tax=Cupriavidus sp. SHE TaxID=1539143 RepID=UPI0004AD1C82|nr:hypothetical protein [Cupriavidus sp. SHE]KWR81180.1 hypothetical protein RN01_16680 [Cupriavidus sp. SHE]